MTAIAPAAVRAWLTVLGRGEPPRAEDLAPLLQGARRRAAQGIDLQSLLRAYRVASVKYRLREPAHRHRPAAQRPRPDGHTSARPAAAPHPQRGDAMTTITTAPHATASDRHRAPGSPVVEAHPWR